MRGIALDMAAPKNSSTQLALDIFVTDYLFQLRDEVPVFLSKGGKKKKVKEHSWVALAKRWHSHKATLIGIAKHNGHVNPTVELAVAKELFKGSRDALHAAARAFYESDRSEKYRQQRGAPSVVDERYPPRGQAVGIARELGADEQAIKDIQGATYTPSKANGHEVQPSAKYWLLRILKREEELKDPLRFPGEPHRDDR